MTARSRAYRAAAITATVVGAAALTAAVVAFSELPYRYAPAGLSALRLGFKLAGRRAVECDETELIRKEAEKYTRLIKETGRAPMKLEGMKECSRERSPVHVELSIDGQRTLSRDFKPGGWLDDGPAFVYGEFGVSPGRHAVLLRVRTGGAPSEKTAAPFDYELRETVEFREGRVHTVRLDAARKGLEVR